MRWATSSSSSRWPASTASTSACSSWPAPIATAAWPHIRSCSRPSSPPRRKATRRRATSARSAPDISTWSRRRSPTARPRPWPWPNPPRRRSLPNGLQHEQKENQYGKALLGCRRRILRSGLPLADPRHRKDDRPVRGRAQGAQRVDAPHLLSGHQPGDDALQHRGRGHSVSDATVVEPTLSRTPASARPEGPVIVASPFPVARAGEVLTAEALDFLCELHRRFDHRRKALLAARAERQRAFDAGLLPDFLPETRHIRDGDWRVGAIPIDLTDRRVEITGPTDRKMVINALNSGAKVFMADFEDATAPTWANLIEGQLNLIDRWRGTLAFEDPATGKSYKIGETPAVLMVRPRGWHLDERHLRVDGTPVAGGLFDFALYFCHNAEAALAAGSGPYFYLPKLESHIEAALWSDVFAFAEERAGLPRGTIKATVLIETIPAAFEMDE